TLAANAAYSESGKAVLAGTSAKAKVAGTVTLLDQPSGLKIDVDITQAPPGPHAFHIHEFGSCANEAKDAGSHYNPASHPHGNALQDGIGKTHAGDFGNLTIDSQGKGAMHLVIPGLSLSH